MPPQPTRGGPLRQRLRDATQSLHDRVEATDLMGRLTRDDLTPVGFARSLRALAEIYAPLEAALVQVPGLREVLPDLDQRFKLNSLNADLTALGLAHPSGGSTPPPWLASIPAALGALYVLEGSTMGARVITARLRQRDFVTDDVLHFFNHYGRNGHEFWQRLLVVLENVTDDQHAAIVDGAHRTFEIFLSAAERQNAASP